MATLLKTLTLKLDTNSVECQLSKAELVDEPTTEDVQTFCGTDTFATPNYKLNLGGFQDWGTVTGVCEIVHDSYTADPTDAHRLHPDRRDGDQDGDGEADAGCAVRWDRRLGPRVRADLECGGHPDRGHGAVMPCGCGQTSKKPQEKPRGEDPQ